MASKWSDDDRARALEIVASQGLPEAVKATGIAKSTLSRWAKEANLAATDAALARVEQTAKATAEKRRRALASAAEAKEDLILKLTALAHRGVDIELDVTLAVKAKRPNPLPEGIKLRDIVGLRTRAIHDLQLLTGEATERGEGPAVVFLAPRPDRSNKPHIIDLGRADDDSRVIEP